MSLAVLILAGLFLVVLARSTARDNAPRSCATGQRPRRRLPEIGESTTVVTGTHGGTNVRFADVVCLTEPTFQVEAIGLALVQPTARSASSR